MCHQGRYNEAIPYFTETEELFPTFDYAAQSLYALASISEMNNDFTGAIEYYEKIERKYPYSNVIVASLVRNANDKLLLRNPQSALLYIQKAESTHRRINNKFDSDDTTLITRPYQKQDFNDNYLENILYLKGEAYNQVERYDIAIANFDELKKTYPNSSLMDFVNMGLG